MFVLDAGDALMGYWLSEASQGALTREAMDQMEYDAMAVGGLDLKLGVAHLRAVADEASFAILSANLVERESGLPVFSPYIVIQRCGVRMGVLGLTEDVALDKAPDSDSYEILPYDVTLSAYLDDVAAQSDIVVLLSHVGVFDDKLLAERFDAIDVIIGGRNARRMIAPEVINDTVIVQLGARGEEIGKIEIALGDDQRPVANRWHVLTLGPEYPDDTAMAALVQRYRETLRPPTAIPSGDAGP